MHKLVVMSVDAMFTEDLAEVRHLPAFTEFMANAAIFEDVEAVYPTLTYPCHTTMLTGCWPDRAGVPHNERLAPGEPVAPWYWEYDSIKVPTAFDYAHDAGLTCASFEWPVTWKSGERIDWNVPEIVPFKEGMTWDDVFLPGCSPKAVELYEKRRDMLVHEYPQFDEFFVQCAEEVIESHNPDVVFMHQVLLDHVRHECGVNAREIAEALREHDAWIGRIRRALEAQGTLDDTVFVVLSDHGQLEVDTDICPNVLLAAAGLLDVDETGRVTNWRAYVQSAGISAHLFIAPDAPAGTLETTLRVLQPLFDYGVVTDRFTPEEMREQFHNAGDFALVLEAAPTYAFANQAVGELFVGPDNSDYKFSVATHGHLPFRGEKPVFMVAGPGVVPGRYAGAREIDLLPTMLKLAGIPYDAVALDGQDLFANPRVRKLAE